jgi:hypothetical protein
MLLKQIVNMDIHVSASRFAELNEKDSGNRSGLGGPNVHFGCHNIPEYWYITIQKTILYYCIAIQRLHTVTSIF